MIHLNIRYVIWQIIWRIVFTCVKSRWLNINRVPFLAFLWTEKVWRRANARNVSLETLYRGQFTLSAQLIKPNYTITTFSNIPQVLQTWHHPPKMAKVCLACVQYVIYELIWSPICKIFTYQLCKELKPKFILFFFSQDNVVWNERVSIIWVIRESQSLSSWPPNKQSSMSGIFARLKPLS